MAGLLCLLPAIRMRPGPAAGFPPLAVRVEGSRHGRIWGLVAGEAARRGGRVSAADVCAAAVATVEVTGAWLSAASGAEAGHLMLVTDGVSEQLAELQLTLGEGPGRDAFTTGGPVLASDLGAGEAAWRWPVFAPVAHQAGVAAVFADTATLLLLDSEDQTPNPAVRTGPGGQPPDVALRRAEIDQATGMLTEQLGTGIADAFVRLRAYAYAHDLRLTDVARDIVARRLRLQPDPRPSQEGEA